MDQLTELYSLVDPVFYDDPARWREPHLRFLPDLAVPDGWDRREFDGWVMHEPHDRDLPDQGWKVHVSATTANAAEIVDIVARYCFEHRLAFKFLRNVHLVRAHNLKYAPRSGSGKVVAVYPVDEAELETCLHRLDAELTGRPGPAILSDLRYRSGPLHVRYGGFRSRYLFTADGEQQLAVERPDGVLVADLRRPVFVRPDWVPLPDVLAGSAAARLEAGGQFGYRVTEALHFSNGGGVYRAVRIANGQEVVLKEARPLAGLSGSDRDAVERLEQEADALRRLDGVRGVPRVLESFRVWEHRFLALERMPGENLQRWLATHHPLVGESATDDDRRAFVVRALRLHERVSELVARVHGRGLVFGDLHPANILVDGDDEVCLVDFEAAVEVSSPRAQEIGHAGFRSRSATGVAIDRHALAILKVWLFVPLTSLVGLAPDKLTELVGIAVQEFDLPADFAGSVRSGVTAGPPADTGVTAPHTGWPRTPQDAGDVLASMAAAIGGSATPERVDRLFPGDPEQFRSGGGTFAHGAAGVLWALRTCGFDVPEEHVGWLCDWAADRPVRSPGFLDGAHGVAHVLDLFGRRDAAEEVLVRADGLVAATTNVSYSAGIAGIGLNLLHLADRRGDPALRDAALDLALRLEKTIRDGGSCGIDQAPGGPGASRNGGTRAGLLRGWCGPALFLSAVHDVTAEARWSELAVEAVHRDLALCVPARDGSLQVDGGFRTLPYLDVGSAGIAVVAQQVGHRAPDARIAAALPRLAAACCSVLTADATLLHGRAGLMAVTSRLSRGPAAIIDDGPGGRHLQKLGWHALARHGHVSFPGDGCSRLSMDLATGTAGVLVATAYARRSATSFLPFLPDVPMTAS